MAHVRLRYTSGKEDGWELHRETPLGDLARTFAQTSGSNRVMFRVAAVERDVGSHGLVGISLAQVASWHIDSIDPDAPGALFADMLIHSQEPLAEWPRGEP